MQRNSQSHLSHRSPGSPVAPRSWRSCLRLSLFQPSIELQGQTGWRASPPCPLKPILVQLLIKAPLPSGPSCSPAAAWLHQRVQRRILISWGTAHPVCTVRQKALPSCLQPLIPPSKGELCWMNCAGENTTTLSVRKLKGALLPKKMKENLKQTPGEKGCPYRKYSSSITMDFYRFSI